MRAAAAAAAACEEDFLDVEENVAVAGVDVAVSSADFPLVMLFPLPPVTPVRPSPCKTGGKVKVAITRSGI
jgi:hypothetical protein